MANEGKLWKDRVQKYWWIPIVIFLIFCMFYPWGTGYLFGEGQNMGGNKTMPICQFCCKLNDFGHSIGIAEDRCVTSTTGGGNPYYTTTTGQHSVTTTTVVGAIACTGIWNPSLSQCALGVCPTGTVCTYHHNVLANQDYCSCDSPLTTTTTTEPLCVESDGGINQFQISDCESAVTGTGNIDSCQNVRMLTEYYCATDGTCDYVMLPCDNPFDCIGGQCVPIG